MKVIQQTVTLLKLQERPVGIWFLSGFTATLGLFIFIGFNSPVDYFGLFCILCSDFMMFFSPVRTCILDKKLNRVTFTQKSWLGTQTKNYSIDKVTGIQVEESNFIGTHFYRLSLRLLSGKRFYLTPIFSTDRELQENIATDIRQFLQSRKKDRN